VPVPQKVLDLVALFQQNADDYRAASFNEANLRQQFVNPLFKALGWDMENEAGLAEAYKDVIHEDAIKIGGATKAPDYCFRIGGVRKFFLEAKKPAVAIKDDPASAYQLRRYAWSGKLPLSILTNFEEFAVYDCRIKPGPNDKASVARIFFCNCDEFAARWDEIAGIFAKEAILKGSFDKFVESAKGKRGTATVDTAFLEEIECWREELAKSLALLNAKLEVRELNFAVQVTIDRIIFLRMCEDRGIEPYGQLMALRNGDAVYGRLKELFRKADHRYNSGLFHFDTEKDRGEPDRLTPALKIDDEVLQGIFKGLYYPESPYEFSALPVEILGQVYEQFLGKVIRLTEGHRAKIEEKPEVKKAGGVYYTPRYIVDYIVKHTVGKLLDELTPKKAAKLSVLDPACGSGSFLLGAYQYLLDWHLNWYVNDGPVKHKKEVYYRNGGDWRLTTAERKRILLNNIYGVDIDAQAVEVTKLSLLLKVLEGESQQSLQSHYTLFHERALPDLDNNIKCGNSLIGTDFENGSLFPDPDELERVNVFDWETAFPRAMNAGGFDAIIGNPPYIRMEEFKELKDYLQRHYEVHDERTDFYAYFIEREHELLRQGGEFGMIVSNKFLRSDYGRKIREKVAKVATVNRIVDLAGLPVFPTATVRTIVFLTTKGRTKTKAIYSPPPDKATFQAIAAGTLALDAVSKKLGFAIEQPLPGTAAWSLSRKGQTRVVHRLTQKSMRLTDVVTGGVRRGVVSGLVEAFVIDRRTRSAIIAANPAAARVIHPFIQGRNIRRYALETSGEFLIYTHHGIDMKPYPEIIKHLEPFKNQLRQRATRQEWYELQQPQFAYKELFESPKIVFPDIATTCRFTLDSRGHFGANTVYFLPTADLYLLGILNSAVAHFYFVQTCAALEGPGEAYLRFFGQYLEGFPVPRITATDKSRHDRVVKLVERMLALHAQLAKAKTPQGQASLQHQIEAADRDIDRLVYDLYGLTPEEIKIVEGGSK
jgi:hypothetical protein